MRAKACAATAWAIPDSHGARPPENVEEVLPRDPAALLVHAACDQRVGESLRACGVVRRDARVERAEVCEGVELEAASGEVAVDEAVGVGDVGLRPRRVVLREVVVVRLKLRR